MRKLLLTLLAFLVMSPCFAATLTVYSASGSGGTTTDGNTLREGSNITWSDVRDGNGTASSTTGFVYHTIYAQTTSGRYSSLYRGVATFDTSDLTSSAIISAAVVATYGAGAGEANLGGTPTCDVVAFGGAANNISTSDYETYFGTTVFGDIAATSYVNTGYNDTTLNASGIAAVSKTGVTKFGFRVSNDTDNSEPPSWDANKGNGCTAWDSDNSSGAKAPKLTVTYTLPTSPVFAASPTVDTITTETATGHANITSDGGATITERGWVLDTSTTPTTSDTKFTTAGTTGSYNTNFTSLTAGTHYYARPHAINSIGTTYGDEVEFDTSSAASGAFFQFFD